MSHQKKTFVCPGCGEQVARRIDASHCSTACYQKNPRNQYARRIVKRHNERWEGTPVISFEEWDRLRFSSCTYCGREATGLDRMDNSLGYEPGNVTPCCKVCNGMKFTLGLKEWLDHMELVLAHMRPWSVESPF